MSVVLPTRDRPRLLRIALECYARQTYPNRELIVVDDGDDAPVDAAAVAAVGGRVLRVAPGLALGSKLNVGIAGARGTLIQKMDDDDFYAATYTEMMVRVVLDSWQQVSRPTMAILMGFLFFDVARWEVRHSTPENAPGATLFFSRDLWDEQPFRGVPRDEDVWFNHDRLRLGANCVTVNASEAFLAVRHRGSPGDRGHTWTSQLDGVALEDYMLRLPLHPGGPETLLPAWAQARYQALRQVILTGTGERHAPAATSHGGLPAASWGELASGKPLRGTVPERVEPGGGGLAATPAPSDALMLAADAVLLALTAPATLTGAALNRLLRPLRGQASISGSSGAATSAVALTAFAAALFARPDLASAATVAHLYAILDGPALAPATDRRLGQVLGFLAGTPAARPLAMVLLDLLERAGADSIPAATRAGAPIRAVPASAGARIGALLDAAEQAVTWDLAAFPLDRLVRIATGDAMVPFRTRLLHGLLEPALLARPADVTVEHLDLLAGRYADDPGFGPLLAYLADEQATRPDVQAVASAGLATRLPLRAAVLTRLRAVGARVLFVHTSADSQRDEIVRVVPLLQAVLAANPDLQATLITARPHLYGNVRLTLVPSDDPDEVDAVFAERFDAVFSFGDETASPVSHAAEVGRRVQAYREQQRPFLFLGAATGDAGAGTPPFVFRQVEVQGRPYAETLEFDRPRVSATYELAYRLMAHLGLPARLGQAAPGNSAVLAALPSQTAAYAWATLQADNAEGRPVALLAPFGDERAGAGYTAATADEVARRLRALIADGYFAVLLPNGRPWGNAAAARSIIDLLDPTESAHVTLGPDPTDDGQRVACEGLGDILVPRAHCQQRTLLAWVQYANLIVGVDGWLLHAAALHGKPYQLCEVTGESVAWWQYGRAPGQAIVPGLPPVVIEGASLLHAPPLPDRPRRDRLLFVLRGLADLDDASLEPVARWALASADRDIRLAATESLVRARGHGRAWALSAEDVLLACLSDGWCRMRAAAAGALLADRVPGGIRDGGAVGERPSAETARPTRRTLRAHWLIEQPRRDWAAVLALGDDATPALQAALSDDDPSVCREAAQALTRRYSEPAPASGAPPAAPAVPVESMP